MGPLGQNQAQHGVLSNLPRAGTGGNVRLLQQLAIEFTVVLHLQC